MPLHLPALIAPLIQPGSQDPSDAAHAPSPASPTSAAPNTLTVGTLEDGFDRLQALGSDLVQSLPAAAVGLTVLVLFLFAGRITQLSVRRYAAKRHKHRSLALAAGRLFLGASVVLGCLVAAVIVFPNFTPTGLLTSLGVSSLVLGLAFKDVLQNYLAGILLLFAEPFRSGDQVIFREFEGTVEDVQPRATFIRTYDGRRVVIPNAELFTNAVTVNTAFERRRIEYDVGIGYGDQISKAKQLILEAIDETAQALSDPAPEVLVIDLAPSSVVLRVRWWIKPPVIRESFEARDTILTAIKDKLLINGVDLPFPTQHVLFHDQTEQFDGDRSRQREGWPAPHQGQATRPRNVALEVKQLGVTLESMTNADAPRADQTHRHSTRQPPTTTNPPPQEP